MSEIRATRVAAIDIGSNSIRLLVAEVPAEDGPLITILRVGEACRLGRGLHRNGLVEEAIAERAGTLTWEFVRRARQLGAGRILIGATAALRDAGNGAEIAARISARCGQEVRILSGEEEARLVYGSVVQGLGGPGLRSSCVVFDLGGGSTEVVSGLGDRAGRWTSLPFGAVVLTERFLVQDPPTTGQVESLVAHVDEAIARQCADLPETTPVLAGVGGTVTAFGILDRGMEGYEPDRIEGWLIETDRLDAIIARLLASTAKERRQWKVLGSGREDIILAGALVVRCLSVRFRSRGLICSTRGLRYGLAGLAARTLDPRVEPTFPVDGSG